MVRTRRSNTFLRNRRSTASASPSPNRLCNHHSSTSPFPTTTASDFILHTWLDVGAERQKKSLFRHVFTRIVFVIWDNLCSDSCVCCVSGGLNISLEVVVGLFSFSPFSFWVRKPGSTFGNWRVEFGTMVDEVMDELKGEFLKTYGEALELLQGWVHCY